MHCHPLLLDLETRTGSTKIQTCNTKLKQNHINKESDSYEKSFDTVVQPEQHFVMKGEFHFNHHEKEIQNLAHNYHITSKQLQLRCSDHPLSMILRHYFRRQTAQVEFCLINYGFDHSIPGNKTQVEDFLGTHGFISYQTEKHDNYF